MNKEEVDRPAAFRAKGKSRLVVNNATVINCDQVAASSEEGTIEIDDLHVEGRNTPVQESSKIKPWLITFIVGLILAAITVFIFEPLQQALFQKK